MHLSLFIWFLPLKNMTMFSADSEGKDQGHVLCWMGKVCAPNAVE